MKLIRFASLFFAAALCVSQADAQWVQKGLSDRGIAKIGVGSSGWFAITSDSGSVFRSTNGGTNWSQVFPSAGVDIALAPNGMIFIAADSMCRSTDGGVTWVNVRNLETTCVAISPTGCVFRSDFLLYDGDTFEISTDNGSTWSSPIAGGAAFAFRLRCAVTAGRGPASDMGAFPFMSVSSDGGQTWQRKEGYPALGAPFAWSSNGNFLGAQPLSYAGYLYLSTDTCVTSTEVSSITPSSLQALSSIGVLVGTDTLGIFLFSDNGDSLGTLNTGLTDLHIHCLAMDTAGYVYAGTNAGVWRRPLSQLAVSVNKPSSTVPQEFSLSQNYPNPFNPSTTIRLVLPQRSRVRLTIYNILGQQVAELANEEMSAGSYERVWNPIVASGLYFYRIEAVPVTDPGKRFVDVKKMIFLK